MVRAALCGVLSFLPAFAFAEASLEVTVFSLGVPVSGVEVRLQNPGTDFSAVEKTDVLGKARFLALSTAGHYTLRVPGSETFYEATVEKLVLRSNFSRSVILSL